MGERHWSRRTAQIIEDWPSELLEKTLCAVMGRLSVAADFDPGAEGEFARELLEYMDTYGEFDRTVGQLKEDA